MAVTVADIVGEPSLRVRGVAGHSGFDRIVSWAATCEMENPWDWLDAGDLLLVNGHGIPPEPSSQELFVRQLNQAGMVGLGIADHAFAPNISQAMRDASDELGFPLLSVNYEVSFSSISKTVARWNHSIDQHSVRLTARIYDQLRKGSAKGRSFAYTLESIAKEVGVQLHVVTSEGVALLDTPALDSHLFEELIAYLQSRSGERLPAVLRFHSLHSGTIALPIPADRSSLLIVDGPPHACDIVILQHIATIAALHIEQEAFQQVVLSRIASDVLLQLIQRNIDTGSAAAEMRILGMDPDRQVVLAVTQVSDPLLLVQSLLDRRIPHMMCRHQGDSVLLLHSDRETLATIAEAVHPSVLGVSAPFTGLLRIPDALAEGQWARKATHLPGINEYGSFNDPLQPRTISEAHRLVSAVLGPLIAYDEVHAGGLVSTLKTFLGSQRSWQHTTRELNIHKQTLAYRIKRIEQILDCQLNDAEAATRIWLALRAADFIKVDAAQNLNLSGRPTPRKPSS